MNNRSRKVQFNSITWNMPIVKAVQKMVGWGKYFIPLSFLRTLVGVGLLAACSRLGLRASLMQGCLVIGGCFLHLCFVCCDVFIADRASVFLRFVGKLCRLAIDSQEQSHQHKRSEVLPVHVASLWIRLLLRSSPGPHRYKGIRSVYLLNYPGWVTFRERRVNHDNSKSLS